MGQVKFVNNSLEKTWSDMVYLNRPYQLHLFKGYFSETLISPFLNTLPQMSHKV